jgi:hypothetical protein
MVLWSKQFYTQKTAMKDTWSLRLNNQCSQSLLCYKQGCLSGFNLFQHDAVASIEKPLSEHLKRMLLIHEAETVCSCDRCTDSVLIYVVTGSRLRVTRRGKVGHAVHLEAQEANRVGLTFCNNWTNRQIHSNKEESVSTAKLTYSRTLSYSNQHTSMANWCFCV